MIRARKSKYGNRKPIINGIKFDSKAEADYYFIAKTYAKDNGLEMRMQEQFELVPKFRLDGKAYRAITYKPDFTFYDNDKLVKVVDVKGMQTQVFKIKAKMFCSKYQIPLILAEKTKGGFKEEIF